MRWIDEIPKETWEELTPIEKQFLLKLEKTVKRQRMINSTK